MHFHVLTASAKALSEHFVTEQQQALRRNGEFCSWMKKYFFRVFRFRTHIIIFQG